MEPSRPERPPEEVLSTGHDPGALERWTGTLLGRRWVRAAAAGVLAVVLLGVWLGHGSPEPNEEAGRTEAAPVSAPGLRPAPSRGQGEATNPWTFSDIRVRRGPKGSTVTFRAANQGTTPAWPSNLRVDAQFLDRHGLIYQAHCVGVRRTSHGLVGVDGGVPPGEVVSVRCSDITHYGGAPARVARWTVNVTTVPCNRPGRAGQRAPERSLTRPTSTEALLSRR